MASVTKNRRDGYLLVKDGAAAEQEVYFMNSDFSYHEPVKADPIPILNRKGELDHVKKNDPFAGWGTTTFSFKYVNSDIKEALCNPTVSTAVTADKIPDDYPCVTLEYCLLDESGNLEETHILYNVWFNRGNVVFNDGDEFSTMNGTGTIFGKYDAAAENDRLYAEIEEYA